VIRAFFKDSVIYGISLVLTQGISVIIVPIYTRILSPEEYGVIDIILITTALVNLIVVFEITQGFARYYADAESETEKRSYASTTLWFSVGGYSLFVLLAFVFSKPLTVLLLNDLKWESVFQTAVISISLFGLFQILQNQLRWQLKPLLFAISSLVYVFATTSLTLLLLFKFRAGVVAVFYGQIIGSILAGSISWIFAKDYYRLLFSWDRCRNMLLFSLPLVPSSISVFISNYADRIALKSLMSMNEVGIYGVGFRFATVTNLLMVGIQGALTPLIYQNYRKSSTPDEIAKIFSYFLVGTIPLYLGISLFSKEVIWLLTTPQYYSAWSVIPFLAFSCLATRAYIFMPGLSIEKKTFTIAFINVTGAILNIILNFTLIPYLGLTGAALATAISSLQIILSYTILSQRLFPIPFQWSRIILSLTIVLMAVIIGCVYLSQSGSWEISIIVTKLLILLVSSIAVTELLLGWRQVFGIYKRIVKRIA
jgi:O-antigen/teichoic acid export membrane protein